VTTRPFTTREREDLFCKLAGRPEGVTAPDVYKEAVTLGDKVTKEAYQNLGRRLVHRGVLVADDSSSPIVYKIGQPVDSYWLDEEELARIIDPDYPILALPIWKESQRQIRQVPEEWWAHIRMKLMSEHAPDVFQHAIESYCADLEALIEQLAEGIREGALPTEINRQRHEGRSLVRLLLGVVRFALGISIEAVAFPESIDEGLEEKKNNPNAQVVRVDNALLKQELSTRIAPEPFIVQDSSCDTGLMIAAVDGSSQSGVMSAIGEEDDFYVGHAPMISINTAVGQVNRRLLFNGQEIPVFTRLPEKPEDLQQRENKYTVMAKLFYADLSDAEYMHSLWNAMDTLEARATLRVLGRWYTSPAGVEVRPADVVLRDGTVVPQDRDFNHYKDDTHYGEIVRDMISLNWEIVRKCQSDQQSVAGVVKNAQVRVFGPILNWYVTQLAAKRDASVVENWPFNALNALPDQVLLTRLLTAQREKGDPWTRTCLVLRPFHATTNYNKRYSRTKVPVQLILDRKAKDLKDGESKAFWNDFRDSADPYVQMLNNVWYGSCFIATVPRLEFERFLPRIDFVVPCETYTLNADPMVPAKAHFRRVCGALLDCGFEVSVEHSMFKDKSTLEVLPELVTRTHDTVKTWARELRNRVDEYLSNIIGRHMQQKRTRGIKVRPFTKGDLTSLLKSLEQERKRVAGMGDSNNRLES
jgi:hypothetical protein